MAGRWAPVVIPASRRTEAQNSRPNQERMLQDRKLVPGIQRDDRLQHRRQVLSLQQHAAPFVETGQGDTGV